MGGTLTSCMIAPQGILKSVESCFQDLTRIFNKDYSKPQFKQHGSMTLSRVHKYLQKQLPSTRLMTYSCGALFVLQRWTRFISKDHSGMMQNYSYPWSMILVLFRLFSWRGVLEDYVVSYCWFFVSLLTKLSPWVKMETNMLQRMLSTSFLLLGNKRPILSNQKICVHNEWDSVMFQMLLICIFVAGSVPLMFSRSVSRLIYQRERKWRDIPVKWQVNGYKPSVSFIASLALQWTRLQGIL